MVVTHLMQIGYLSNDGVGANYVEDPRGRLVDLRRMAPSKRKALAARLNTPV